VRCGRTSRLPRAGLDQNAQACQLERVDLDQRVYLVAWRNVGAGREAGWPGRFGSGEVDRSARGDLGAVEETRRSRSSEVEQPALDGLVAHVGGPRPLRNINRGQVSRPVDPGVS
jgi:hypothetical protein